MGIKIIILWHSKYQFISKMEPASTVLWNVPFRTGYQGHTNHSPNPLWLKTSLIPIYKSWALSLFGSRGCKPLLLPLLWMHLILFWTHSHALLFTTSCGNKFNYIITHCMKVLLLSLNDCLVSALVILFLYCEELWANN